MSSGAGKNSTPAGEPDKAKMMRVVIPALAVVAVVILVAVLTGISDGGSKKMSDGSNGLADDPDLKADIAGVGYRDLKEGTGKLCPPGATVKVFYTGWLVDGSVFDSNKKSKTPAEFKLGGVIMGWQRGIPGMKIGGIRKLVVSPEMGYSNQNKPKIPPYSTLIFEVELVDFAATASQNVTEGTGTPMSDGSNGGTDDPGLKPIGSAGLKYRDLKEGTGAPVVAGTSVTVHYTGWLADGTVFDSSKKNGKPFTTSLNDVVKGWGEGIPGMKPGGIRKLVIPGALGYGARGAGSDIPPNATLIFEVELIN